MKVRSHNRLCHFHFEPGHLYLGQLGKRSSTQSGECAALLSCIMSGKMKSRASANSTDSATVTVNEKILKE